MRTKNSLFVALLALGWAITTTSSSADAAPVYGGFSALDAGARGAALGSNLVALTDDSDANRWNPAGLLLLGQRQLSFSSADLFDLGLVQQTTVQFGWPILERDHEFGEGEVVSRYLPPPAIRAFGLSLNNLTAESVGGTDYHETEIGLNFAWRSVAGTFVGAGVRILSTQADNTELEASGHSFQVGVLRPFGDFRLGLLARDFASAVDWKEGADDPLPQRFAVGLAWLPSNWPLRATSEYGWRGDAGQTSRLGAALEWDAIGPLTLRGGATLEDDAAGSELEWSSGAGFHFSELRLDYGFTENGNELGTTHRWSASLGL